MALEEKSNYPVFTQSYRKTYGIHGQLDASRYKGDDQEINSILLKSG